MELIGFAGIENLKSYLRDIQKKTPIGPNAIELQNKIDNECLCPILTGVCLIDDFKKVELLKECGVTISKNPSVMGQTIKQVLVENNLN